MQIGHDHTNRTYQANFSLTFLFEFTKVVPSPPAPFGRSPLYFLPRMIASRHSLWLNKVGTLGFPGLEDKAGLDLPTPSALDTSMEYRSRDCLLDIRHPENSQKANLAFPAGRDRYQGHWTLENEGKNRVFASRSNVV